MNKLSVENRKQVFRRALSDGDSLSRHEFEILLGLYPYSQPLRLAYDRFIGAGSEVKVSERTLLFYDNKYWLSDFLSRHPGRSVEDVASEVADVEVEVFDEALSETAEHIIFEGDSEDVFVEETIDTGFVPAIAGQSEGDDVSIYDDVLMPYSFRWWLYKTRLVHAETYQPFAKPNFLKPHKGQFDPQKLEFAVLDQQIRENIFHLQNPEEKLSDSVKHKTVEATMTKKTDRIIERFIQKDPQIQPPAPEHLNTENKARRSSEDQLTLVSETLANIYESQGLYPKAIEVFNKLILLNPEKKSYFASRIEEIESKF